MLSERLITLLFPLLLLCSCGTTKYVPVETVRVEYKDRIQTRVDSVVKSDSVFVLVKGDTVIIKEWHDRWRDRLVHDTAFVAVYDSIQVPYPVEKPLTKWEQAKMDLGGIAMGIALAVLIVAVVWMIKRFRK